MPRAELSMLCMVGALLTACTQHTAARPTIQIKSITAYKCQPACTAIDVDLVLNNPSDIAMCFPVRYITPEISKSLVFTRGREVENYQIVADLMDHAPLLPDSVEKHVAMLRDEEPNVIVQPHAALPVYAQTGDKYIIPRRDVNTNIDLFLYPCDRRQYEREGYFRLHSVVPLTFAREAAVKR